MLLKLDLPQQPALMNAPGTLGFAPNPRAGADLSRFNIFVTNAVSLTPRLPAEARCMLPFPGGFLLHTGLPNPGLREVIKRYAPRWGKANPPIMVHIIPGTPEEAYTMVRRLEGVEGVVGIEIGLPPHTHPEDARQMVLAASGELPLVVSIPLERAAELAPALIQAGIQTASLQAPRGVLPGSGGKLVSGRLYGPAVLPWALAAVQETRRAGIEVISAGGVYREEDIAALHAAGAVGVQLDAVLWRGEFLGTRSA